MESPNATSEVLTPRQLAKELQMGHTMTYRLLSSGAIPSIRISPKLIRVRRSDLEQYLEAHREGAPMAAKAGK